MEEQNLDQIENIESKEDNVEENIKKVEIEPEVPPNKEIAAEPDQVFLGNKREADVHFTSKINLTVEEAEDSEIKAQTQVERNITPEVRPNKNTIITIPNLNFNDNVVKIEDYVIYEQEAPENESDIEEGASKEQVKQSQVQKKNEAHKTNSIILNVESLAYKTNINKNIVRRCSSCDRTDLFPSELLKFKTVEEFLVYFRNIFEKKAASMTSDFEAFSQSRSYFNSLLPTLSHVVRLNLKSVKYLCKNCVINKVNSKDGMKDIYKALDISQVVENYNIINKEKMFATRKVKEYENVNYGNVTHSGKKNVMDGLEGNHVNNLNSTNAPNATGENNIMRQLIEMQNNLNPRGGQGNPTNSSLTNPNNNINNLNNLNNMNNTLNSTNPMTGINPNNNQGTTPGNNGNFSSLVNNFNKLVDGISTFNNKHIAHNQNLVSNVSQLAGAVSNYYDEAKVDANDNNRTESVRDDNSVGANDQEKKDDGMNVTNIVMNFDHQNQKNPVLSYMMNVLEDLKKQIVNIQYYSMLQKMFISYIFKNLEVFMDQIVNHQNFNDFAKTNPGYTNSFGNIADFQNAPIFQKMMNNNNQSNNNSQNMQKNFMENMMSQPNNLNDMMKKLNSMGGSGGLDSSQNPMDLLKNLSSSMTGGIQGGMSSGVSGISGMNSQQNKNMTNLQNSNKPSKQNTNQINQNTIPNLTPNMGNNLNGSNTNNQNQNSLIEQLLKRNNPNMMMPNFGMGGNLNNLNTMNSLNSNMPFGSGHSSSMGQNNTNNMTQGMQGNMPSNMSALLSGMPMLNGLGGGMNMPMGFPGGMFNSNPQNPNQMMNKQNMPNNFQGQSGQSMNMPMNLLSMMNGMNNLPGGSSMQNLSEVEGVNIPGMQGMGTMPNMGQNMNQNLGFNLNSGEMEGGNEARDKLMKMFMGGMNSQMGMPNMPGNMSQQMNMSNLSNMNSMNNLNPSMLSSMNSFGGQHPNSQDQNEHLYQMLKSQLQKTEEKPSEM